VPRDRALLTHGKLAFTPSGQASYYLGRWTAMLIVRENVIETVSVDPIRLLRCGAVTWSENRSKNSRPPPKRPLPWRT
jgi:hypothetical protein